MKFIELMKSKFQNREMHGVMLMQGTNISKLQTQIQCVKKRGSPSENTQLMHTGKQVHTMSRYQHKQREQRAFPSLYLFSHIIPIIIVWIHLYSLILFLHHFHCVYYHNYHHRSDLLLNLTDH